MSEESQSKGRPTQSRKAAEAERKEKLKPTRGSKLAKQQSRERDWQNRTITRRAMYTNDETHLPIRDKGPVRRYVRNFVDRQISLGELFVPFAFVVMVLLLVPNATLQAIVVNIWMMMFLGMFIDGIFLTYRLKKALRKDLPDQSPKGAASYAIMRALTFRPMRLPKPMVKVGGAPRAVKLPKSLQR